MERDPERMKKISELMLTGALDLVAPEHRLDRPMLYKWWQERFLNPTEVTEWNGYHLFPGFEAETAKHAYYKFRPRDGDVLVATYGKTGTNWVHEILCNIIYMKDKDLLEKTKRISRIYSYLEMGPASKYKVVDNLPFPRRLLGTHLPAPLINLEKFRENGTKVFYVIRNPKDQVVSFYNFAMGFPFLKQEPWSKSYPENEKEFYDSSVTGQQPVFAKEGEGYLDHVRGWYDHRNDSNVMFLVYEEMKKDTCAAIQKMAKFLDVDLSGEEVADIARKTSFENMKKEASDPTSAPKPTMPHMFRKGQVGDWKTHLTVAQSEMIDANVKHILGDTDIKFIYELGEQ